jgi:hypothetical protein
MATCGFSNLTQSHGGEERMFDEDEEWEEEEDTEDEDFEEEEW